MANLTGSQKKNRNKFIALLVAILLVAAAIFYVVYAAFMAKSAYLENQDFATALSEAFGKSVRKVSQEDLAAVKYLELYNDGENASVYIGYDDFVGQFKKYVAETEAAAAAEEAGEEVPEITTEHPVSLAKYGLFEGAEELAISDVKYFTGAEIISVYGIALNGEDFGELKNLTQGSFSYCGLDNADLAALASKLDLAKVEELTFMGNSIDDWSPVESISDKVVLQSYGYTITEDGQLQMVPSEQTLTEYLASLEASEEATTEEAATEEAATEEAATEEAATEEAATEEAATEEVTEETTEVAEETVEETVETTEATE